jgi:hypothetical protein
MNRNKTKDRNKNVTRLGKDRTHREKFIELQQINKNIRFVTNYSQLIQNLVISDWNSKYVQVYAYQVWYYSYYAFRRKAVPCADNTGEFMKLRELGDLSFVRRRGRLQHKDTRFKMFTSGNVIEFKQIKRNHAWSKVTYCNNQR